VIISVASGKGGTGKTTVALALAVYLAQKEIPLGIFDCDVEEPNVNLFLQSEIKVIETVYVPVPYIHESACNGCGACADICAFSALVMVKGKPLLFPEMCHACGGCMLVCPEKAITYERKEIGIVEEGYRDHIRYVGGKLRISEPISPPLIEAVKKHLGDSDINILDVPPGTSCPVIEAVKGSDYIILVTEPTPFGLYDLKLAVEMVREIRRYQRLLGKSSRSLYGVSCGVVINRCDIGDSQVSDYCQREGITVIASIPDSRELAERYSHGDFVDYFIEQYPDQLESIISHIPVSLSQGEISS